MKYNFIFALISFLAGVIGRICGLGGGVIIKPVMDATGIYPVKEITFMSACTVLAMTLWSVSKSALKKDTVYDIRLTAPLTLGSAVGGLFGKWIFSGAVVWFGAESYVGLAQSLVLVIMLVVSLVITLMGDRVKKFKIRSFVPCVLIGCALGFVSAFIGGGSGPINMAAMSLLFSMSVKTAALNSLFIIMSAQVTSVLQVFISRSVPDVDILTLALMAVCAVLGAELGRVINRRIPDKTVNVLFSVLIITLIGVNLYNIICYM